MKTVHAEWLLLNPLLHCDAFSVNFTVSGDPQVTLARSYIWWMKRLQSPVYYCHQISKFNYIVRELGSQYLFHKCAIIWSKNINGE